MRGVLFWREAIAKSTLCIPSEENDIGRSLYLLTLMLKSVVAAIALVLIPSVALSQSDVDAEFLQGIQSRLTGRYSNVKVDIPTENKIILGLKVCVMRYNGASESDVNTIWAGAIHSLPESRRDEAVTYFVALDLSAVATYCPQFQGRK